MNIDGIVEIVTKAVKSLNNGVKSEEYNSIVSELSKKPLDETVFCAYLNALRKAVKYINKQHETLIGVILNIDWAVYEIDAVRLFIEFLGELVSAKTYYVKVCIRSLIKQFVPKTEVFNEKLEDFKRKCDHIHNALQTILRIAPLSAKYLGETIKSCFPYAGKSLFVLETYTVHILQISAYVPDTRLEILQLIIATLIKIDVHVSRHELEQEAMDLEMEDDFQFDLLDYEAKISSNVNACKLDQLMNILFAYIDSVSFINNTLDYANAESLVKDILLIFDNVLLKSQSSHVQFVLFYVASFHKNFTEYFIEACWKILHDPNYACVLRRASSCYLSSFLARAKFIEMDVIMSQIKRLSDWIHRYMDIQTDGSFRADQSKHAPFYSACQSLFYVFIYHYKSLVESSVGLSFMKSINLIRIVTSRLNPLKFCQKSVVNIFARITRMYQIVFCYSVIEKNNRLSFIEQLNSKDAAKVEEDRLGVFFPFDPFMLPRSKKWIAPSYMQWNLTLDDEESDDEELTEETDTSDWDFEAKNTAIASNFDMMCISPGFQFQNGNES